MLSTKICIDCQIRLDESFRLKIQITDTQRKLHRILENLSEISIEMVTTVKEEDTLTHSEVELLDGSRSKKRCRHCKKRFRNSRDLSAHIERIHYQRKDFNCDLCSYRCYKKFDMMLHHRNIHLKDSSDFKVLCPDCGARLRNNSDLRRHHLKQHLRIKRFQCGDCDFSSFEKSVLRIHSRTHLPLESRELFSCGICGKVLSTRSTLKAHVAAVHENIRSYACSWCPRKFAQKSCLEKHQNSVHLMVQKHQCDICHIFVSQACYLKKHKQLMHPPDGKKIKHSCRYPDCTQNFTTQQALRNHQRIHSDPEFYCHVCLKKFYRKNNLLDHMETHQILAFPCPQCKRSFRNESKLNHHLKSVHFKEKQTFRCEICSSTFTRRTTYRDHVLKQHKDNDDDYQKDLLERISKMLPEERTEIN